MATRATTEEHREMLLKMVDTWESLARDRQEQIARRRRIVNLDAAVEAASAESDPA
jgi:hypothetical protein